VEYFGHKITCCKGDSAQGNHIINLTIFKRYFLFKVGKKKNKKTPTLGITPAQIFGWHQWFCVRILSV